MNREILALAVPAFATLVSEPLLVMADSAVIGRVGTAELAGLGIAGNVIGIIAGLCIFLAYGTTASVSRLVGAGRLREALTQGFDGMGLGALIGAVVALALQFLAPVVVGWYHPAAAVEDAATTYLRIVALGFPALLVMLASTGVLRGLQDTRTPLYVAVGVNLMNIALNVTLVLGLGMGIAGAGLGTVISQYCAAAVLSVVVLGGARREGARLAFRPAGVLAAARDGIWLVLRTASVQTSVTATTVLATSLGTVGLAAHQVTNSVWTFLAFALDALAIACQAIIGRHLGAGDQASARAVTRTALWWGVGGGVLWGVGILLLRGWIARAFTPDLQVQALIVGALVVVALLQPLAGLVFVLDGVLIGAGDAKFLSAAGWTATAVHLLFVALLVWHGPALWSVWVVHGIFTLARGVLLTWRQHGDAWMRLGAA